jgi:hypothetical protein
MLDDGSSLSQAPESTVNAGYTYFGQFVDHDLTRDRSSIADALRLSPEQIHNHQTPRLDLGHLYGDGPFDHKSSDLYECGDVRLKVGDRTAPDQGPFDVGTTQGGLPAVADDRTVENVILRQVAGLFARLHNAAVEQFRASIGDPIQLFERARLQTTWQFQWLIWHDYLFWLLDIGIYRSVFGQRRPLISWDVFSIPVEFSAAAMRFGHSMVRETYTLARGNHRTLREIFDPALQGMALPNEWRIDWGFFFQGASPGGGAVASRPIDVRITPALHNLPPETILLFNAPPAPSRPPFTRGLELQKLPVRTLIRGAALRIASGQSAAAAFGESIMTEAELTTNRIGEVTAVGRMLRDTGMASDTPLWYYILKESEVRYNGNRLGPVGSRIMAECFFAILAHDPDSFLNHRHAPAYPKAVGAEPPIWNFRGHDEQLRNLRSLFAAAEALP